MTSPGPLVACPGCGASAVPGTAVCGSCGTPLQRATRRVVTLLFADLVGYTRLCASLDVEQVYLLVRPLMNALRRVCEDLGGVVPGIEGDGFMAVFGAQHALEDDPQRAVSAAVRMQRLVQERRSAHEGLGGLRVGLNTGEVLVAPSWEPAGFSVAGDAVNVASRLAGLPPEGGVLAGDVVASLVVGAAWSELREAAVKNREVLVEHRELRWQEVGAEALGRRVLSDLPYVDRPADAALLAAVTAGGSVHLLGEPGAGKSRALDHLRSGVPGLLLARAPSFVGPGVRSQLAVQLLEDDLGLVQRRALEVVAGLPVDSDEPTDPDAVLRSLLAGRVVAVDDAHLATGPDLALVEGLVADGAATVVLASRPDDAPDLHLAVLELAPLDDAGGRAVLDALLPGADERLVALLLGRSGGNPLYLEQAVQMLVEDGTVEVTAHGCVVRVPDRLTAVPVAMRLFVSSRLDLLDERQRDVLSTAAVVGDPVDLDLLRHLDGRQDDLSDVLSVLLDRGLLRWGDGGALVFKHQVVRDVAYESQLRSRRLAVHRAAAEWYSSLPVRGLLSSEAQHLEAAVALGDGDCELVRRAVHVLDSWAQSLLDLAPATGLEALRRAEALVRDHPDCAVDELPLVVTRAATLQRLEHPQALEVAKRAVALSAERDAHDLHVRSLVSLALAGSHEPDARDVADRAIEALRELGDEAEVTRVELQLAVAGVGGAYSPILQTAERAYDLSVRLADDRLAAVAAQSLAFHLPPVDPASAVRWLRLAEGLLRPDDVVGPVRLQAARCVLESTVYDVGSLVRSARELHRMAVLAGIEQHIAYGTFYEMEALTELGRLDEAVALVPRALEAAERRPFPNVQVNALSVVAAAHARRADWDALAPVDARLQEVAEASGDFHVTSLLEVRGLQQLATGRFADAYATLTRVVELDDELQQEAWGLRTLLRRLVAALAAGERLRIAEVQRLRTTAREIGAPNIAALAARWLEVDEALRSPHDHALDLPEAPDLAEARALDSELVALRGGDPDALLDAAREWASLGAVVWHPRALLWHEALTGVQHPEAVELLEVLRAPDGLADTFRRQVSHLLP